MVRFGRDDDLPHAVRLAAAGGSPDADVAHFAHVASVGRLLVAVDGEGHPVGVAGSIAVGRATMVTDLFVDESHRGRGIGGRLVGAVVDGSWRRFTFSSTHPAALPAYERVGMRPRWQLLTLRGPGEGGGAPPAAVPSTVPWRHERAELVAYLAARGAEVGECHVLDRGAAPLALQRLVGSDTDARRTLDEVLRSVSSDSTVELSLAEHDTLVPWLLGRGFEVFDTDVCCASDGVEFPPEVRCVHRGLC